MKKEDREYETACRIIRHRDQLKAAIEANDILGMKQGCQAGQFNPGAARLQKKAGKSGSRSAQEKSRNQTEPF